MEAALTGSSIREVLAPAIVHIQIRVATWRGRNRMRMRQRVAIERRSYLEMAQSRCL
jgi:hypothetical protein